MILTQQKLFITQYVTRQSLASQWVDSQLVDTQLLNSPLVASQLVESCLVISQSVDSREAMFQISSLQDVRNPIKDIPIHHLQVGSLEDSSSKQLNIEAHPK